jgi:hypothetical protein
MIKIMELKDFKTVHRVEAKYQILINWKAPKSSGNYNVWLKKEFAYELPETQDKIVGLWVKKHAPESNIWGWTLTEME